MYIYRFISILNHIWTFLFKHTLPSSNFLFSLIKTHILHLIQFVIIVITFQKFLCFVIHGIYFFGFSHLDFIHYIVNNSVVFLIFMEIFSGCGVSPAVLSRMVRSILSSKLSQDLIFIRIMSSSVYHTGHRIHSLRNLHIIYGAFQRSHTLWGDCFTRRLLLYYSYWVQYSWILPK